MSLTAILIFARSSNLESSAKPLSSIKKNDVKLYARLNKRVNFLAVKSGLPYFIYDEHNQIGDNFGVRLTNAMADTFKLGFDNIIILGNDCPQLRVSHIAETKEELERNSLVIGPDMRGGAYLIGINKDFFDAEKFKSFNWQTSALYADLQGISAFTSLPALQDINYIYDVRNVIKHLSIFSQLRNALLLLVNPPRACRLFFREHYSSLYILKYFSLRAPPAFA